MKNLLLSMLVSGSLVACATGGNTALTDNNVNALASRIKEVPSGAVLSVKTREAHKAPTHLNQALNEKVTFETASPVYDKTGKESLVPLGSIITGIYYNNGNDCKITFSGIYATKKDYENSAGLVNEFQERVDPVVCVSSPGLKRGQKFEVTFK